MIRHTMSVTTLDSLDRGQKGRILEVTGDDAISVRLMEMGLTVGEEIEVIGFAPLGDPIEFFVRGFRLSLRGREARRIQIESVD
ncbi:MAG: ferrous iron transport protein A [Planctomycetota bacterium]|nr:ferrous iron transport protein A [Planctomycetota bacterium]MED5449014.1 ferrous iron transport protein A [Planctomycetota bacterium]MEE3364172.1 ferrous iron transport protein A [Planctomycetota bacterium]